MSRWWYVWGIPVLFSLTFLVSAGYAGKTQISYSLTELGGGSWQYSYEVSNISLGVPIKEFTIRFDYGLYENLAITTPNPPARDWDELVFQSDPVIGDDGFYDALHLTLGIGEGQSVSDFSVSFDWLSTDTPGSQFYEIVDPDNNYITIDSGFTVPEPATSLLMLVGYAGLINRGRRAL